MLGPPFAFLGPAATSLLHTARLSKARDFGTQKLATHPCRIHVESSCSQEMSGLMPRSARGRQGHPHSAAGVRRKAKTEWGMWSWFRYSRILRTTQMKVCRILPFSQCIGCYAKSTNNSHFYPWIMSFSKRSNERSSFLKTQQNANRGSSWQLMPFYHVETVAWGLIDVQYFL